MALALAFDYFKIFQGLLSQSVETLGTETTLIQEKSHKLFDILSFIMLARITLPINEGMFELAKNCGTLQPLFPLVAGLRRPP